MANTHLLFVSLIHLKSLTSNLQEKHCSDTRELATQFPKLRLLACFCATLGIAASFHIGDEMRSQSHAMWLNDARAEALRISGFINSSVTQTLSSLRSYSALFYGSINVSAQEFSTAAKFVQSWDAEIPID